jgi:N6-L-threonylcarbamoyladenine synthase
MLGLGYPGGPIVETVSKRGDPESIPFPKVRLKGNPLDFSFSGIKTAVKNRLNRQDGEAGNGRPGVEDVAASFQRTVVEMLVQRVREAVEETKTGRVVLTGGVACNQVLRTELKKMAEARGVRVLVPSPRYCTDNAAMIAVAGYETHKRLGGDLSSFGSLFEIDADPGWTLGS